MSLPEKNPIDRGAWQPTVHGVAKSSDMTKRLNKAYTTSSYKIMSSPLFMVRRSSSTVSVSGHFKYGQLEEHMASLGAQWWRIRLAMQKTQVQSVGREDPLEKGMATHSSNLAWEIPWTEEPGRLQSRGLQRSQTEQANNNQRFRSSTPQDSPHFRGQS